MDTYFSLALIHAPFFYNGLARKLNNGLYTLNLSNMILCLNRKRKSNDSLLWHQRLSHISDKRIVKLVKEGLVDHFDPDSLGICESCIKGKMAKAPFLGKG